MPETLETKWVEWEKACLMLRPQDGSRHLLMEKDGDINAVEYRLQPNAFFYRGSSEKIPGDRIAYIARYPELPKERKFVEPASHTRCPSCKAPLDIHVGPGGNIKNFTDVKGDPLFGGPPTG